MRVTFDLPADLLDEAKEVAAYRGITLELLIEQALRSEIASALMLEQDDCE